MLLSVTRPLVECAAHRHGLSPHELNRMMFSCEENKALGKRKKLISGDLFSGRAVFLQKFSMPLRGKGILWRGIIQLIISVFMLVCLSHAHICGSSWARDWTDTTAVTQATAWQCQVLSCYATRELLVLLNQTWVRSQAHSKVNLLTLGCGEGKCSIYYKMHTRSPRQLVLKKPKLPNGF